MVRIKRSRLTLQLAEQAGPDVVRVVNAAGGWPSEVEVRTAAGWQAVDLYIAVV
jgi:hypothetical protein